MIGVCTSVPQLESPGLLWPEQFKALASLPVRNSHPDARQQRRGRKQPDARGPHTKLRPSGECPGYESNNHYMKLLIVSPSQGVYGGMEGFVLELAAMAQNWPEFEVQVCFKLKGKVY